MIKCVAATGSTNRDALAAAAAGAPEGYWLRADLQTDGHGRLGRVWQSPPGNLYASTIVRVQPGDPSPASLALVTAVAVHETLAVYAPALALMIKWPNDILIGAAKLAGMLLERQGDAIVIGIGINLAAAPAGLERAVTCLADHGPAPDPGIFIEDLASGFARWLGRWRGEGLAPVRAHWLAAAHPPGTALAATLADGNTVNGLFDGLENEGGLRLRLADGSVHVIHAGDVFLV